MMTWANPQPVVTAEMDFENAALFLLLPQTARMCFGCRPTAACWVDRQVMKQIDLTMLVNSILRFTPVAGTLTQRCGSRQVTRPVDLPVRVCRNLLNEAAV